MAPFGGISMYHYQRLRDLREDADKSQTDLAAILQISQQHYALYESGKRELPMHHFITLARYYNVSLDYLAGLLSTPRPLV
jgi:transcriptional regulator with XRE-family HTH domain